MKTKQRPRVGDEKWEVEWCSEIPKDENGDSLMDEAKMHFALYKTKEEAIARAKKELPGDAFGSVRVTQIRFVAYEEDDLDPYAPGFWEYIGETTHVDE